jgi:phenylalanyl-tRNA synthetase alpha chain
MADNIQNISALKDLIEHHVAVAAPNINAASDLFVLDEIRVKYFGKNGIFTDIMKNQFKFLSDQGRPKAGEFINQAKQSIDQLIQDRKTFLTDQQLNKQLFEETIDITLPGRGRDLGSIHPITQMRLRMEELFGKLGFMVVEGPEIEDEFHNFTALNILEDHPARTAADTFYLENSLLLLRTQTSPGQIRSMKEMRPPLRVVVPGRVYRRDFDATHTPMFHQLEGLLVDETTTLAELKGLLHNFFTNFFAQNVQLRFRASYFPFVEPGAEVDLQCFLCKGSGCRVCKSSGWIEVGGCGMVHPNVFQNVNIDSERYNGFAFGMGIDRIAMFYYGINDLRLMFENDIRFLEQF